MNIGPTLKLMYNPVTLETCKQPSFHLVIDTDFCLLQSACCCTMYWFYICTGYSQFEAEVLFHSDKLPIKWPLASGRYRPK